MWDFFISHASDDKTRFVQPLAEALRKRGFKVWYDDFSLKPGDSLRRSIDRGISEARAGVVVLSPRFFEREWPQRELDALVALEIGQKKKIYPVWLDVDAEYVARFSPLLADKVAIRAKDGVEHVVRELSDAIAHYPLLTDEEVEQVIAQYFDEGEDNQRFLRIRSLNNFIRMISYYNEYERALASASESIPDDALEEHTREIDKAMEGKEAELIAKYDIPPGSYLQQGFPLSESDIIEFEERLTAWCGGMLGAEESFDLYMDLDEWLDSDYLLVFYSIPNDTITLQQRQLLQENIPRIGARNLGEPEVPWDVLFKEGFERYWRG